MRVMMLAAFGLLAATAAADAHGAATWIMNNPTTNHCCGPSDCNMEMANDVEAEPGGWFVQSTKQHFRYGDANVYPSIDAHYWTCRHADSVMAAKKGSHHVRCLFVPTQS